MWVYYFGLFGFGVCLGVSRLPHAISLPIRRAFIPEIFGG
jgi:hypothetical protein